MHLTTGGLLTTRLPYSKRKKANSTEKCIKVNVGRLTMARIGSIKTTADQICQSHDLVKWNMTGVPVIGQKVGQGKQVSMIHNHQRFVDNLLGLGIFIYNVIVKFCMECNFL